MTAHERVLQERIRALEAELAEYRGLIDGDVDAAWRELQAKWVREVGRAEQLEAELTDAKRAWPKSEAQLIAERDALKARVAELEKD